MPNTSSRNRFLISCGVTHRDSALMSSILGVIDIIQVISHLILKVRQGNCDAQASTWPSSIEQSLQIKTIVIQMNYVTGLAAANQFSKLHQIRKTYSCNTEFTLVESGQQARNLSTSRNTSVFIFKHSNHKMMQCFMIFSTYQEMVIKHQHTTTESSNLVCSHDKLVLTERQHLMYLCTTIEKSQMPKKGMQCKVDLHTGQQP